MSVVHVVPEGGVLEHITANAIGCWCIPAVDELGQDAAGDPAILIKHVLYDKWLNPTEGWGVYTQNSPTIERDDESATDTF